MFSSTAAVGAAPASWAQTGSADWLIKRNAAADQQLRTADRRGKPVRVVTTRPPRHAPRATSSRGDAPASIDDAKVRILARVASPPGVDTVDTGHARALLSPA